MLEPVVPQLPQPDDKPPRRPVVQRCPNCEMRLDVSLYVDGALARCGHCGVRFQVRRERSSPPPRAGPNPYLQKPVVAAAQRAAARAPEPAPPREPVVPREPAPQKLGEAGKAPLPQLEGFLVHERLGQGGMGEVLRCTRLSDHRLVAVKILTPQMAAVPDYVRRFGREAAAMAQLDHPGIVRLLGRGRTQQHCWIAMELIEGTSLRTWAFDQRPSARQLARLLAQVAHALAYAHARSVVHRDLKPDNVLVTHDARTKVLDFGLAGLHLAGEECLTQSHVSMGTANYMAPEQRKDAKRADHRADLYSFGVMAYELLTGELPIGRFQPPSKLLAGLDPRWDAVVERCLMADPAARPHSALELAHALESLGGVGRAEASPQIRRRPSRSGLWSWFGIGAGAAVVLGVTALRVAQDHGTPARVVAAERPPAPPAAARAARKLRR